MQRIIDVLASREPVPGGGGASALAGAVGIALGAMVGELTVGKKKYAEHEAEISNLIFRSQELIQKFDELVTKDAEAFLPLGGGLSDAEIYAGRSAGSGTGSAGGSDRCGAGSS